MNEVNDSEDARFLPGIESKNKRRMKYFEAQAIAVCALLLAIAALVLAIVYHPKVSSSGEVPPPSDGWAETRELEDRAIAEKDRKAFEILREKILKSDASGAHVAAVAAINRIELFYLQSASFSQMPIRYVQTPEGKQEIADDRVLPLAALCETVRSKESSWQLRARAAMLLGNHKDVASLEALTEAVRSDQNLSVLYFATLSLKQITGVGFSGVFGDADLVDWVGKNREDLEGKLADSGASPPSKTVTNETAKRSMIDSQ